MALTSIKIVDLDLPTVKEYLRVDFADEDAIISAMTVGAQSYVKTLLGYDYSVRWPNKADMPDELTVLAFMIIAHWYENRQIQPAERMNDELDYTVTALANAWKDPFKDYVPIPCADVTNLSATSTATTITLTFTQPTYNFKHVNIYKNGVRYNYKPMSNNSLDILQDFPGGGQVVVDAGIATPLSIQDLTPSTTYNITVTTVSMNGDESQGVTIQVTTTAS